MFSFIEQREKQNAKELAESYTESSINAFKTILRVKNDWETLKNQMTQTTVMGKLDLLVKNVYYIKLCMHILTTILSILIIRRYQRYNLKSTER